MQDDFWRAAKYGEDWAEIYDDCYPYDETAAVAVEFLAELAGPGPVLELAIGSGRIAIPLSERGTEVHGVDASQAMVDLMRSKPGGDTIPVTIANFRDVPVEQQYDVVALVCNTIFGLVTQDEQLTCFRNVAAHLKPGGLFVVECFVPTPKRLLSNGQAVQPWKLTEDSVLFHILQHNPVDQIIDGQTVRMSDDGGVRLYPSHMRYIWPTEMDLMARLAGMRLQNRWASWLKDPFGQSSESHVSVYELEEVSA